MGRERKRAGEKREKVGEREFRSQMRKWGVKV